MFRIKHPVAASLILSSVLFAALPRDAAACGGEWGPALFEPDHRPRVVPLAEKALERGNSVAAAGFIVRAMPHIRSLSPTKTPIVGRAERVLALALARHGGALPLEREVPDYARGSWGGRTEAERAANLSWASGSLRALHDAKRDDPALETDLAEALSKLPATRQEARDRLEQLAKRDLIGSAEGYAVLAELRAESGDKAGEKLALTRCRALAKGSTTSCGVAGESAS